MANIVEYDATKHSVDSVTVFQADRAEIKRKIQVDLKDGQNDVEVKNLPTCLDEGSIRVDGIGNAIIFDVVYHAPPKVNAVKEGDSVVEGLKKRKRELTAQLAIFNRQAEVLRDYSKTLGGKDTNADQLDTFLDVYASRQATIDSKLMELEEDIKKVDKSIEDLTKSVGKDLESVRLRGVKITIVVLASGDGEAELSLTYVVSKASWSPQYDLRAAIATDPKSQSSVELHYRASIRQYTGEDWNGVNLTLSTASPLTGTDIPKLEPYWISERRYKSTARRVSGGVSGGAESMKFLSIPETSALKDMGLPVKKRFSFKAASVDDGFGPAGALPPGFFGAQDSEAVEGAVSTTFGIPGLSTIPSDPDDASGQQTHKVSVAQLDFSSVSLEWIAVPREIPSTFLQCNIQNSSKYVLLAGPANVFMNNNFVSKSRIPHVSPQESFTCSLGVDPAVRIVYHPQSKKTKTSGGGVLSSKTTSTTFEQIISIKNTRLTTIHRLVVKEQIPVSHDARIKVSLVEPRALATAQKTSVSSSGVQVLKGVQVKWVPRGEDTNISAKSIGSLTTSNEEIDAESAQGMLEWTCEIEPGVGIDLLLGWEVSAPASVGWAKQ